ncbi:nitrogen regulatory protein P-II homolog isoform X2 [Andrographis paniculata]|uniref:nitrogen regulatory protein P-II homolog isoform X2 n=1 Tax=Andrographis paniculata TaxID=175694 RepID=UPI0021E9826F|nr:nitrogen regulatory protein P-II homolog isoform X2 [Andrographis paniculata]
MALSPSFTPLGASSSSTSPHSTPCASALLSASHPQSFLAFTFSSCSLLHHSSLTLTLKRSRTRSSLLMIRSQTSTDFTSEPAFYKVEAILRPWRIPQVSSALLKIGIRGVTVSDVRGFGAQGDLTERHAGSEFSEDKFIAKVKMEIVVCRDQVEEVVQMIIEEARTGEIGDGKIFLIPVSDVIRIRTGERGEQAERMAGGRADLFSHATGSLDSGSTSSA